jgi:hypothetical protein
MRRILTEITVFQFLKLCFVRARPLLDSSGFEGQSIGMIRELLQTFQPFDLTTWLRSEVLLPEYFRRARPRHCGIT